jgi:two-component system, NarL family, nitrate/nitrite response regulator NarL
MSDPIRVVILDDHQSIIDGYCYRLSTVSDILIVGTLAYGASVEPFLQTTPADVLILDVNVPTAPDNLNPYPILHLIRRLLQLYSDMAILVISMHNQRTLIQAIMEAGASGYIVKDDRDSIRQLASVITSIANGGVFFSQQAHQQLSRRQNEAGNPGQLLTPRQLEVLSLCAAYPGSTTAEMARKLGVENSTVRNLLSSTYVRLNVNNRAAALAKARLAGLIPPLVTVPPNDL